MLSAPPPPPLFVFHYDNGHGRNAAQDLPRINFFRKVCCALSGIVAAVGILPRIGTIFSIPEAVGLKLAVGTFTSGLSFVTFQFRRASYWGSSRISLPSCSKARRPQTVVRRFSGILVSHRNESRSTLWISNLQPSVDSVYFPSSRFPTDTGFGFLGPKEPRASSDHDGDKSGPSVLENPQQSANRRIYSMEGKARKIATHSGVFHADEALACFMLKQLPEYADATITRTRDPEIYGKCDIVVDVGGVYDPTACRFDHHQRTFGDSMHTVQPNKPWTIKLSSAGLVYCHYGRRVIAQILGWTLDDQENGKNVELIYDKVYDNFIAEMDAIDNGIPQCDKQLTYQINTGLSSRVKQLNPRWNEENPGSLDDRFAKAVQLTGEELVRKVKFYAESFLPARHIVEEAIANRHEVDPSGVILRLPVGGCPWQDHLLQLEVELKLPDPIKFVFYQDDRGHWRVQAVPVSQGSFSSRLPLAEPWRGLVNERLSEVSGIPDCIFAHHSGFIGGNKSYVGALAMAQKTMAMDKERSEKAPEYEQSVIVA